MKRRFGVLVLFLVLAVFPVAGQMDSGWEFEVRSFDDTWLAVRPTHPEYQAVCARDEPFEFYVRPEGDANKLMVVFSGGGACWDALTCREGSAIFSDSLDTHQPGDGWSGVLDFDNPQNPVGDYQTVAIPYCTGDVFMGAEEVTYQSILGAVTVEHQGFTNGAAVRQWIYEQYPELTDLLITGLSAGAYGSIFHAPYLMDHYPDAHIVQLGDSGVGVIPQNWNPLEYWGIFENLPQFIPAAEEVEQETFNINVLYRLIAEHFPQHTFSQFTHAEDSVQRYFYEVSGGAVGIWAEEATVRLDALNQNLPNFYAYVAPGETHTILVSPEFYTVQAGEVTLVEWLTYLLDGSISKDMSCMVCDMCK